MRATRRGMEKWWDVLISPIHNADGAVASLVAISRDITEAKLHERALAEAKATAEAASRAKDDFLAALSHELRTPLNPVLIIASEREADLKLSRDVKQDFTAIRKNVELEARLIDDLLDLTRIERGKLRLDIQTVNLQTLLQSSLDLLTGDIAAKRLELVMEDEAADVLVKADPVRMQQVFWNVIKNAVRFTPGEGRITVSVFQTSAEWVRVEVKDTGVGIDPAELQSIFTSFNQGRSGHRFGGLGLGLAITRGLMDLHGGQISAASEGAGKGALFTMEIPRADPEIADDAGTEDAQPDMERHERKLRILLVEDHEATSAAVSRLLRSRHHHVTTAGTRKEALAKAGEETFDLVLSDVGLPDGSGYDVMRRLQSLQPGCKGIALSGYGMDADISTSLAAGFEVHLTKPVVMQTLLKAIEKVSRGLPQ